MIQQTLLPEFETKIQLPIEMQEYVPCSYEAPHEHLPLFWRVVTKNGDSRGSTEGVAHAFPPEHPYPYGYIFLDRIYQHAIIDKAKIDRLLRRIAIVYYHEFFHLYFHKRFDPDYDTHNFVKGIMKIDYKFTYARNWGSNERIIDAITNAIVGTLFDDIEFKLMWLSLFMDLTNVHLDGGQKDEVL